MFLLFIFDIFLLLFFLIKDIHMYLIQIVKPISKRSVVVKASWCVSDKYHIKGNCG